MTEKQKQITTYMINKLGGAGFSFCIFLMFILFSSNFDLYEFSEAIKHPLFWAAFFVYGIVCSILIDILVSKLPSNPKYIKAFLHVLAGFIIFLAFGINILMIIAGAIGGFAAILFYFGTYISARSKIVTSIFAFLIPIIAFIIIQFDFTVKTNWKEEKGTHSYEASFDYFNGEHRIPIRMQEGEKVMVSLHIHNFNGGGHGYHVRNAKGKLVGMERSEEDELIFRAADSGIYEVVIKGHALQGQIDATWQVEDR
ncbi:hypothetical protein [Bacillus sp. FJAT-50079]|uniref:hypothetical protein n=1 Tax=Bacillus sp. FJAT-50079 TaxID=2833577 RepID=UPI001BC90F12|nr:hypothetical protein [Bacillus sp. FJAT-50079]MBS4209974.1 hypothetical protein [Bacillus sp. FJAT-50079]